jgi:hypothetical protein
MSTTEGWTTVMYNGVDARSPELAPRRDSNPGIAVFFVAFMVVGNFFILNLFVGIILDNFSKLSSESGDGGSELMTKAQKMWVKSQQKLQSQPGPDKADYYPEDPQRKAVYLLVEAELFEWFIMGIIVLNAIAMVGPSQAKPSQADQRESHRPFSFYAPPIPPSVSVTMLDLMAGFRPTTVPALP